MERRRDRLCYAFQKCQ